MAEIATIIDELRDTASSINRIADELTDLFSYSNRVPEVAPAPEKALSLEEVRAILAGKSRDGFAWLRDAIFPIGSIRMTTSTTGATTFLGGTWVLWGAGKVPVGVDANDTDFSTVEKTGGAKTVTLTAANMPSHNHALSSGTVTITEAAAHTHQAASGTYKVGSGSGSTYKYFTNGGTTGPATTGSGGGHTHTANLSGNTGSKGSGTAHSNVQPYITCYFYKRTA